MSKTIFLREITQEDWEILLEWRNDDTTRKNFHSTELVNEKEHKNYIKGIVNNPDIEQFILEYNGVAVGTIRSNKTKIEDYTLSYTISPLFRGKKIGQLMLGVYLLDRTGIFFCEVKETNLSSVRMIEKLGFKFLNKKNGVQIYKLIKQI